MLDLFRVMGQSLRCHRESRKGTPRLLKKKKPPISARGHLPDSLQGSCNQVNLNLASEEELMTLPGVNRVMAHSITVYRHRIGGFRKVEDLALVSGFGAEKMQQLRSEICVGAIRPSPRPMRSSCLDLPSSTKVNLNTATLSQLLRLGCLSEDLARAILSYRTGHGAFRHFKDLKNISGVDEALLNEMEPHLTISLPRPATVHADLNWEDFSDSCTGYPKKEQIPPNGPGPRFSKVSLPTEPFSGLYRGRAVVRVGSCNFQGLTLVKAGDHRLREELCLTLLKNGITLLAIQGVLEEEALEKLCMEMETPSLPAVRDWPDPRGSWRYVIPEYEDETQEVERPAFLWDSTSGLELVSVTNVEMGEPGTVWHREQCQPLLGHFKVDQLDFKMLNVHLKLSEELLEGSPHVAAQLQSLRQYLEDGPQLLVLGVFRNGLDLESLNFLQDCGFRHCITGNARSIEKGDPSPQKKGSSEVSATEEAGPSTEKVLPGDTSNNGTTGPSLNNIWSSSAIQAAATGRWGVTRNGLGIPRIPCDPPDSSVVSHGCLMWVELYRG